MLNPLVHLLKMKLVIWLKPISFSLNINMFMFLNITHWICVLLIQSDLTGLIICPANIFRFISLDPLSTGFNKQKFHLEGVLGFKQPIKQNITTLFLLFFATNILYLYIKFSFKPMYSTLMTWVICPRTFQFQHDKQQISPQNK